MPEVRNKRPRTRWALALLGLVLVAVNTPIAASSNLVSVGDTTIGTTTTYTVTFKTAQSIGSGADLINFNSNNGADLSGANYIGVTGGSGLVMTQASASASLVVLNVSAGSAATGTVLSLEFSNVVNPAIEGPGPDYTVGQIDGLAQPPIPVFITLPGTTYTGTNEPVVVNPISDRMGAAALEEGQPPTTVSKDLDAVFEDADGDSLTFSLDSGTDTTVATAQITPGNALDITPVGSGTTSVSVRATAVDGFAVDSFEVQVIGLIDDAVMSPDSLGVGETTSYVLSFSAAGTLASDKSILIINDSAGPDYTGASLTFSGGTLGTSLESTSSQAIRIALNSGSAAPGTLITITLDNVVNPGAAGPGPEYIVRVVDPSSLDDFDRGVAQGNVFEAGGAPFVVNPIDNQNLNEVDGPTEVVADITTVFDEDDGDPISYSVLPVNDPLVATAALIGGALIVSPTGPGTTTITVEASDADGLITDSFEVAVIGIMDNASFAPANTTTSVLTDYTLTFNTSSALDSGVVLIVRNLDTGGPDYSGAQLSSFVGGNLVMDLNAGGQSQFSINISSGTASVGDAISFILSNVLNPAASGSGPDYESEVFRLVEGVTVETAVISGSEFEAPIDPMFEDQFESLPP